MQAGNLTKEHIMAQVQKTIIQSRNTSLNTFFSNYDCYKGRILETWDFQEMFNLSLEQATALQSIMGDPRLNNRIDFESFVNTIYKQYCSNLTLNPLSEQTVYANRIKICKIKIETFQFLARGILEATSDHTYSAAFDKAVPKPGQKTVTKDELFQMLTTKLSVKVDPKENEDIFNYLKLDISNVSQVSKVQFVQGFKFVLPESQYATGSHIPQQPQLNNATSFGTQNIQPNNNIPTGNTAENEFFFVIKQFLQTKKLNLDQALSQVGANPTAQQIHFRDIQNLGRTASTKPMQDSVVSDFLQQYQDFQPNFVKKATIQRLIDQATNGIAGPSNFNNPKSQAFPNPSINNPAEQALRTIKDYLDKNYVSSIEKLFPQAQTMPGRIVICNKQDFLAIMTAYDKVGLGKQDVDSLFAAYEANNGINLTKISSDLQNLAAPQNPNQEFAFDQQPDLNSNKMTPQQAMEQVNIVFDAMKRYIAINGGNIITRFREIDSNGDQMIQKNEMAQTLMKLGLENVGDNIIEGIYQAYDTSNQGEIPYIDFCKKFYINANNKQIKEPTDWIFPILEQIRKYLKNHRTTLASVFATDLANYYQKKDVYLENYGFFQRLMFLGVQINQVLQQKLVIRLDPNKSGKIDYLHFADLIGYDQPDEINQMAQFNQFNQFQPNASIMDSVMMRNNFGKDYRKNFYRTLCRHMKQSGFTVQRMQKQMGSEDVNNSSFIQISTFINQLMSFCMGSELFGQKDLISSVAKDFDFNNTNQVHYIQFCQKINYETDKLHLLEQFFMTMKQALDFKNSTNLYEMLQAFDTNRNKKFSKDEISTILKSKSISSHDTAVDVGYLFDEYDPKNTGSIDYIDLEKDYNDFVQWMKINRPQQNVTMRMNLPQILQQIKFHSEYTGKSLREIFNKINIGDSDEIFTFDFSKIMNEITNQQIDTDSINRLIQELNVSGNSNNISFIELMKRFNDEFHIREDPYESKFNLKYIDKIYWHIAKIASIKSNKLTLENHFEYPASNFNQFISDLEKGPLHCLQIGTKQLLEELARKYQRGSYVDTKAFTFDINDRVKKLQLRASIFLALKKQLQFRGSTIEEAFKNIKGLGITKDEHLTNEEFYAVLLSVEYKIDMAQLVQILDTFPHDNEGRVSYVDFVKDFNDQVPLKEGIQARRFFQSERDIVENIAQLVVKRGISKQFGNLLASSDLAGKGDIKRDAFYRAIESMNFNLGEGDIQELIKAYDPFSKNMISLAAFTDEINRFISDPYMQIQLYSQINDTVKERVVDVIQLTPRSMNNFDKEFKANPIFQKMIQDIYCGLLVKTKDLVAWFKEYAKQPSYMIQAEFMTALDHLDVQGNNEMKNQLYDNLIRLQSNLNSEKLTTLQMDFIQSYIGKDFTMSKWQMTQQILRECAQELTTLKVPVKDQFLIFDPQNTGQVFRNDFSSNILENYLRLSSVLSINKINLLLLKYDPNQTFRVTYTEFISDLKQIEAENPHVYRICLSAQDVQDRENQQEEENKWDGEQNQNNQNVTWKEPEPVARSKMNTVALERDISRPIKLQIPSFQFEDIMVGTYRREVAVEVYFKQHGRLEDRRYLLDKNAFYEALQRLGLRWANDHQKVSDMFSQLDMGINGRYERSISSDDIGLALLQNTQLNIIDYQARAVESIYKQLKDKKLLGKLRDLFNFYNTRRDSTCSSKEFKQAFYNELNMKQVVSESDIDILVQRYRVEGDNQRVSFAKFLKDIELVDKGISPSLLWATEFAEDIMKSLIVFEYSNLEQFFSKFIRTQGIILLEEFQRAMDDLQITLIHDQAEQKDFFNSVDQAIQRSGAGANQGPAYSNRVSLTQLVNSIQKLLQKSLSQIYQEILEKIYVASKRVNLTVTVFHIFNEYDQNKTGYVTFQDFKYCIEMKLKAFDVKTLDIEVLAKKYKTTQKGMPADMLKYDKFFQDYENIEKLGLRAGEDPLKRIEKMATSTNQTTQPVEMPAEVKKIYNDMGNYVIKMKFVDGLCEEIIKHDAGKTGFVPDTVIAGAFRTYKMTLNTKQMNLILHVLPFNSAENVYNYMVLIEHLFGKAKAVEIQQRYKIVVTDTSKSGVQIPKISSEIRPLFKDTLELKLNVIQAFAHQISKGSYQMRETEFFEVFKMANINLLSQDVALLQQSFRKLMNLQSRSIDFNEFISQFQLSNESSSLLAYIQRIVEKDKIELEKLITNDLVDFQEFEALLKIAKIDVSKYQPHVIKKMFMQICEGQIEIQKGHLIRVLNNNTDLRKTQLKQLENVPYVVNELAYFIVNNGINIFRAFSPSVKALTRQQVSQFLSQIKFQPSNPKEIETLFTFLSADDNINMVSTQKVLEAIQRIDPLYGQTAKPQGGSKQPINKNDKSQVQTMKAAQFQLSQFTTKIKQILAKMNDHFKKNKLNTASLHTSLDKNKNGVVERDEMLNFFRDEMAIAGVGRTEIEQIFDAIDFNRDGFISINEFCLYIEGTNLTYEQKMLQFDKNLENEMKKEIDKLFQFFDKNGDGRISVEEVTIALKAINPQATQQEAQAIIALSDKNKNGFIDKDEFEAVMLPKYKEDIILNENNLDDLRRLFKEADVDHSNYLNKSEIQNVLVKNGVELTLAQLDELMSELDIDMNGAIDIDEFIAFMAMADQFKFKHENSRYTLINIRRARQLHPIDFYNAFKNLPQHFTPSFTQERFEQHNLNTPSHHIYPEFDSASMTYKDLNKMADFLKIKGTKPAQYQTFTNMYCANIGCEIQMEEATGVFLPKKDEYDWANISHREIRAVLFDFQTKEYLSNSFIVQANWRAEYESKWLFNYNGSHQLAKNFMVRTDLLSKIYATGYTRDIHLLFELVLYTKQANTTKQVTCAWGSIPITQLDKAAKQKIQLKGGSPMSEVDVDLKDIHQSKKGFQFLKKIVVNTSDSHLIFNVRPQAKFSESSQLFMAMLPQTCLVSKRLLSFVAAFRLYCFQKLTKAQQQMIAPQGDFVIAQFRKIYDNPDIYMILGECWENDITQQLGKQEVNMQSLLNRLEDYITKTYSVIYSPQFYFDHIYPTRSQPMDSEIFLKRETLLKQLILPVKSKLIKDIATTNQARTRSKSKAASGADKGATALPATEVFLPEYDYKPFNICEMDIEINGIDPIDVKQDELLKMYKQMGMIY